MDQQVHAALSRIEAALAANYQGVDSLQRSIAEQYASIDRSRRAFHSSLVHLTEQWCADGEGALTTAHAPTAAALDSVEGGERESNGRDGDAGGVRNTSSEPTLRCEKVTETIGRAKSNSAAAAEPVPANQHDSSVALAALEAYTQRVHQRMLECEQRQQLSAAKAEFAHEWARVVLPWFRNTVYAGFYLPLLARLDGLRARLDRLGMRLSLDLPQYTVRPPHYHQKGVAAPPDARGDASCAPFSNVSLLWWRYLITATRHTMTPSIASTEKDVDSTIARDATAAARLDAGDDKEDEEEEEVVIVPSSAARVPLTLEALYFTPRSLRHIMHVLRCGLTESDEEDVNDICGSDDWRAAVQLHVADGRSRGHGESACGANWKDSAVCLLSRVEALLWQHSWRFPALTPMADSVAGAASASLIVGATARRDGDGGGRSGACVLSAVSLLMFLRRLCLLRDGLGEGRRHLLSEDALLLPFHLFSPVLRRGLHAALPSRTGAVGDAGSRKRRRVAAGDDALMAAVAVPTMKGTGQDDETCPLLEGTAADNAELCAVMQWWTSPQSWPCRTVYARLLRMARLYKTPSASHMSALSADGDAHDGGASAAARAEGILAGSTRVRQLRRVEVSLWEQWQAIEMRLLTAPPDNETV